MTEGFIESFGVSAPAFLGRPTTQLTSSCARTLTAQIDLDHPVNVVEGKDSIVLQVCRAPVLHLLSLDREADLGPDLDTQVTSTTTLKGSGKQFQYDCLHVFRFNDDYKVVSHDEWQVRPFATSACISHTSDRRL